jgi:hypothetical protein
MCRPFLCPRHQGTMDFEESFGVFLGAAAIWGRDEDECGSPLQYLRLQNKKGYTASQPFNESLANRCLSFSLFYVLLRV